MRFPAARTLRYLAVGAVFAALAFPYGVVVGHYEVFPFRVLKRLKDGPQPDTGRAKATEEPKPYGTFNRLRNPDAARGASQIKSDMLDRLTALGYEGAYEEAPADAGVMAAHAADVQPGLTLFCSGHGPVAQLLDRDGKVVHEWRVPFERVFPDPLPWMVIDKTREFIRRAHVLPNGDLIGIYEYVGIFKVDKDSNVLWRHANRNHHDFQVLEDGSIISLGRQERTGDELAKHFPGLPIPKRGAILDDQVIHYSPEGKPLKRVSLIDAMYHSEYAVTLLTSGARDPMELFHTNSVYVTKGDERPELFKRGQVLLSMRDVNLLAVLDMESERIAWAATGKWYRQHQASLLANGNILLFDNRGGNAEAPLQIDRSEVLEVDPLTKEVAWRYRGPAEAPFFSHFLGYVQRLENGNTLITESTQGRIFEVNRDGDIVWQYINPHRAGKDEQLIATAMGAQRYAHDALPFLKPAQ